MTVQQIINLAKNGELKQLAVKDDVDAVLGYLNLGLIELYKRFPLKVEEAIIELRDDTVIYDLPKDCMWLITAYGEVSENDSNAINILNINTEDDMFSINTISWDKIQVPSSVLGDYISIIYAASPPFLTEDNLEDDLGVPPQLLEALTEYIAFKGHASQNGDAQAENNVHYQRFEASCVRVKKQGMITPDDVVMPNRIEIKGFI